jgi:hypothetical protein
MTGKLIVGVPGWLQVAEAEAHKREDLPGRKACYGGKGNC